MVLGLLVFFVLLTTFLTLSNASVLRSNNPCNFLRESQFQETYEDWIPANCERGRIDWHYPYGNYSIHFRGGQNADLCVGRAHYRSFHCRRAVNGVATVTLRGDPSQNAYMEILHYMASQTPITFGTEEDIEPFK